MAKKKKLMIDEERDLEREQQELANLWLTRIEDAEKKAKDKYLKRCEKITKEYSDARDDVSVVSKVNILWSNTETIKPVVYSRKPNAEISRRFKDAGGAPRLAGEVLERGVNFHIDDYGIHDVFLRCRDDYVLYARGVNWVRYKPYFKTVYPDRINLQVTSSAGVSNDGYLYDDNGKEIPVDDPKVLEDEQGFYLEAGDPYEAVDYEEACVDYVHREDFLHSPARNWEEVSWVGRISYLDKKAVSERFGKDVAEKLSTFDEKIEDDEKQLTGKYAIYEIWDKSTSKCYWISKGHPTGVLDQADAPVKFKRFFPCPKPAFGTLTSDSLNPIPDYILYQDLAIELNELSTRIRAIAAQIKATGVYDGSINELFSLLSVTSDGQMLPISNWQGLVRDKGINASFEMLDISPYARVLEILLAAREQVIGKITEVTGLSDIVRGYSKASETATAQDLKGRYANLRLGTRQAMFDSFVRSTLELVAEVIAQKFQPETIAAMANIDQMSPEEQALFPQALQILKSDVLRNYKLDIETDSTKAIDEKAEVEAANEFSRSIGTFLQAGFAMSKENPLFMPVMGELLLLMVRKNKAGRTVEGSIEQMFAQMTQAAQQPQPPSPEQIKMQGEQQKMQFEMQLKQMELQSKEMELELKQSKMQLDLAKSEIGLMQAQEHASSEDRRRESEATQASAPQAPATQGPTIQIPGIEIPAINIPTININMPEQSKKRVGRFSTGSDGSRYVEILDVEDEASPQEEFSEIPEEQVI